MYIIFISNALRFVHLDNSVASNIISNQFNYSSSDSLLNICEIIEEHWDKASGWIAMIIEMWSFIYG